MSVGAIGMSPPMFVTPLVADRRVTVDGRIVLVQIGGYLLEGAHRAARDRHLLPDLQERQHVAGAAGCSSLRGAAIGAVRLACATERLSRPTRSPLPSTPPQRRPLRQPRRLPAGAPRPGFFVAIAGDCDTPGLFSRTRSNSAWCAAVASCLRA